MSKLSDARDFVSQYGHIYGWYYDRIHGLQYSPSKTGMGYYDQWAMISDIDSGSDMAESLKENILYIAKYDLRQAINRLQERKHYDTKIERMYANEALELLQRQYRNILDSKDISGQILNVQNVFREPTDKAFRQTPYQRASKQGIKERAEHSVDILNKALHSNELNVQSSVLSLQDYEDMKEVAAYFGVNLDEISQQKKIILGNPYKVLEEAYMEVGGQVADKYNHLSEEDLQVLMNSDIYAKMLRLYGFNFT